MARPSRKVPRRNPRTDVHHLLWEERSHKGLRRVCRALPCLKVPLDVEVHRVLHQIYTQPRLIPADLAQRLIIRHRTQQCACYTQETVETNILHINHVESAEEDDHGEAA